VLRGFDYGLLAMLATAVVYGVAWSVVALTWGLIAIGFAGGWFIGTAVREGVAAKARADARGADTDTAESASDATASADEAPVQTGRAGMSSLGALLGAMAWIVGSFVAFAIGQLTGGSAGGVLDPERFAAFMASALQLEPTWLQPAVLAAFVVAGWYTARPRLPRRAAAKR
jgi:hypothetical protein